MNESPKELINLIFGFTADFLSLRREAIRGYSNYFCMFSMLLILFTDK